MTVTDGETVCRILQERCGRMSFVRLLSGRTLSVLNIAWGRDMGDDFDHITTNISPDPEEHSIDLFFTSEVVRISDDAGQILFELHETQKA